MAAYIGGPMSTEDIFSAAAGAQSAEEAAALALIAGVPSTAPPPVDLNAPFDVKADGLGLTETELVEAGIMEAAPVENWRPVGGQEVQLMLRAITAGFERTPGVPVTKSEVLAFLGSKGL